MIKAKLVVVGGDAKASEVDLTLPTVIGRSRDVTLTLPHPLVSRRHTVLFEQDGYLYVKDLGSLNGTYVNNRRIDSAQRLKPNELLTLGNVTFRALYDADIAAADVIDDLMVGSKNQPTGDTENVGDEKDETVSFGRTDQSHQAVEHERLSVSEFDNGVAGRDEPQKREPLKSVPTKNVPTKNAALKSGSSNASSSILPNSSAKAGDTTNPSFSGGSFHEDRGVRQDAAHRVAEAHHSVVAQDSVIAQEETPSSIFSGDEGFITPEKSISVSALESLPPVSPAISVLGSEFELEDRIEPLSIESVDLDAGDDVNSMDSEGSDVALGSFLKKLPR